MLNWLWSKKQPQGTNEETAVSDSPILDDPLAMSDAPEFGPVTWTVWFDSGLELHITGGQDNGRTLPLDYAFLVLGRTRHSQLSRKGWLLVKDETVSRRQAYLAWDVDSRNYVLYHLEGATNPTVIEGSLGPAWSVCAGINGGVGRMQFQIRKRSPHRRLSTFVQGALNRMICDAPYDDVVPSDLALTIIDEEHRGDTFMLTRHFHPLHRLDTTSPGTRNISMRNLLHVHSHADREQALLIWNEEHARYELIHNAEAPFETQLYPGTEESRQASGLFTPVCGEPISVSSTVGTPVNVGDTIQVGELQLRLHRWIRPMLEGTVRHMRSKGWIELIPPIDHMLATLEPTEVKSPRPARIETPSPRVVAQPAPPAAVSHAAPTPPAAVVSPPAAAPSTAAAAASVSEPAPAAARKVRKLGVSTVKKDARPVASEAPKRAAASAPDKPSPTSAKTTKPRKAATVEPSLSLEPKTATRKAAARKSTEEAASATETKPARKTTKTTARKTATVEAGEETPKTRRRKAPDAV